MFKGLFTLSIPLALLFGGAMAFPVSADGDDSVGAETGSGGIMIYVHEQNQTSSTPIADVGDADTPEGHFETTTLCATGGSQTCGEVRYCDDGDVATLTSFVGVDGVPQTISSNCDPTRGPNVADPVEPQLTLGLIAEAFQRVPLPARDLQIQPPNGRTLVNFSTNFFTDATNFTRNVTLLGHQIELRISPILYRWQFGDGFAARTNSSGSPYPNLDVTHKYLRAGFVQPAVDITYDADYRVDRSSWRPVPGTVTVSGNEENLEISEARPTLLGYTR